MIKLFKLLIPNKKQVILMLILLFTQVLGTLYIPTLTADIVNKGILKSNTDYVFRIGTVMIVVAIGTAIVSAFSTYFSSSLAATLSKKIREKLFRQSQNFSLNDFNRFGTSSMTTRSTNDVIVVQRTFSSLVEMLLPAPVMTIVGLILAFSKSPTLAGFIVVGMFLIFLYTIYLGKKTLSLYSKMQKVLDKITKVLRENITGIRVIRAFNRADDEKRKEDTAFTEYAELSTRVNKIFAYAMPLIMLVMNFLTILILWFGGKDVIVGSLAIGDIMAVIEYAMMILMYIVMAAMGFMMIPRAESSARRINEVLEHVPEFSSSKEQPKQMQVLNEYGKTNRTIPKIEFRDVTFRYKGAEEPVLQKINFTVENGETLAIIGSTGSGKSTIANVLSNFYSIESGEILIDGIPIESYSNSSLRKKIGLVPQTAFLFSGTIADNLQHGKKNATIAEMKQACEIAQAKEFIEELEKGLDSSVAQGGNNFSGGQKQRLAIARTIIKEPEIYIFDDSFSALDFKTDKKLRLALAEKIEGAAMIIIAQRVNTIIDADKIIVLEEGEIVGSGTHDQLLTTSPVYQQIARSQISEDDSYEK